MSDFTAVTGILSQPFFARGKMAFFLFKETMDDDG